MQPGPSWLALTTIWVIHQQHKGKNSNQYLKIPNLQLPQSFDEDLRLPKPG